MCFIELDTYLYVYYHPANLTEVEAVSLTEVFYSVTVAVIMFYVQRGKVLVLIYYIEGELKFSL